MVDAPTPKGEQAMLAILDAAEHLFLSKGFHGTSMRDIASTAGYKSVAGIYNHFSDKEAIFVALLNARSPYATVYETIAGLDADHTDTLIRQIFETLTTMMREHINFVRLVMLDYLEFNAVHVQELLTGFQAQLMTIYDRFATLPDIRHDIPPMALMRVMGIQIFGYMMTGLLMPQSFLDLLPEQTWKDTMMTILIKGLESNERD